MLQLTLDLFTKAFRHSPVAAPRTRRLDHTIEWKHNLAVHVVFHPRARRYLLNLREDGSARLVIPRRGTEAEGLKFLERSEAWLQRRLAQWKQRSHTRAAWTHGSTFLFRGEETSLIVEETPRGLILHFADQAISVPRPLHDYREPIHRRLRAIAECELPIRTRELAAQHNIDIKRITIRAQKTRWGSCSTRGTISLNWRLIQAPPLVLDYLIIHELMHRRQMNHSARYWKLVAEAFPDYRTAEKWLRTHRLETL